MRVLLAVVQGAGRGFEPLSATMTDTTADLCDRQPDDVGVVEPIFSSFGGRTAFEGSIATMRVHEDNVLVRAMLEEPGEGRVLVIDGGGSLRCALLGDQIATLAETNGWSGVVVNGCVRDTRELAAMPIGIVALAANPRKSEKRGEGERDIPVRFAGVTFTPGARLVADEDGIIVLGPS
jgi:regulator of ribonuclease activity A